MKFLIILFLINLSSCGLVFASDNLYEFPDKWVNELLVECEKNYRVEYPQTFPEAYSNLSSKRKLHYCMRKLMQTGNYEEETWFRQSNIRNEHEQKYEREIGALPDEYFLIETWEERKQFLAKGFEQYYAKKSEEDRQRNKKIISRAATVTGFVNPPVGWMLNGAAAVQ